MALQAVVERLAGDVVRFSEVQEASMYSPDYQANDVADVLPTLIRVTLAFLAGVRVEGKYAYVRDKRYKLKAVVEVALYLVYNVHFLESMPMFTGYDAYQKKRIGELGWQLLAANDYRFPGLFVPDSEDQPEAKRQRLSQ